MTGKCPRSSPANCNPTTRFNCEGRLEGISSGPLSNGGVLFCCLAAGAGLSRSCACCGTGDCQAARCRPRSCTSARTREDVIYREELDDLARSDAGVTLRITLTRDSAPGWAGAVGRIDLPAVRTLLEALGGVADSFVCGSAGFVEAASALLVKAGQPGHEIRTERFGPTGT